MAYDCVGIGIVKSTLNAGDIGMGGRVLGGCVGVSRRGGGGGGDGGGSAG